MIVAAVARAYVRDWMNLDGSSGESGIFFEPLDTSLADAIRSGELSEGDRQQWQRELEAWRAKIDNYGIDDGFAKSLAALAKG